MIQASNMEDTDVHIGRHVLGVADVSRYCVVNKHRKLMAHVGMQSEEDEGLNNLFVTTQDGFEEQSLSDDEEEKHDLHITKGKKQTAMGSFTQVLVYIMFMCVVMGMMMLALHIVARNDPNRATIIAMGLAAGWIALVNLFAFVAFIVDKYHAFNSQPRMSEAFACTHFALGGVLGGWLALCMTCYKPPGSYPPKMSGFICRCMLCSTFGIGLIVALVIRVIIPNIQAALTFSP